MTQNSFPMCELKNKECKEIFTCKYLKNRFGVLADPCMSKTEREKIIKEKHEQELKERYKLIGIDLANQKDITYIKYADGTEEYK